MCRVTCAHCHDSFLFNTLNNALARYDKLYVALLSLLVCCSHRILPQVSSLQKSFQCGTGICQDQVCFLIFLFEELISDQFFIFRSIIFLIFGLIVLGIGIGITGKNVTLNTFSEFELLSLFSVGTLHYVAEKGGLYVVYVGAFLVAALLLLRSLYYCVMKISLIEGPI